MLKCQFHIHVAGDPEHSVPYDSKKLIDEAEKLGYDVLSFTCHRKVIFNTHDQKYANKKGILLIPGIEFEINRKHILGINVNKDIEKVKSFADLKVYISSHPDCLIIAAHPYFPSRRCLKHELVKNIDLFDAIEHSFCYTTTKNYNRPAEEIAKKFNKPMVATADCHTLEQLNLSYSLVESNKDARSIIKAIKKNKITPINSPLSYFKIFKIISTMTLTDIKDIFRKRN